LFFSHFKRLAFLQVLSWAAEDIKGTGEGKYAGVLDEQCRKEGILLFLRV
jgi:hypothetical protein